MNIESHWKGNPPIYVSTHGLDWNEWMYLGGAWYNLMSMSWEEIDPPAELQEKFDAILDFHEG